jgi:hypothetical protein
MFACCGAHAADEPEMTVDVVCTDALAEALGGTIRCIPRGIGPYAYVWAPPEPGVVLELSADSSRADNVPPGVYSIAVADARGGRAALTAEVRLAAVAVVRGYAVEAHPSSDTARDGVVRADIGNLDTGRLPRFLWTGGVVTDEPVLRDVSLGLCAVALVDAEGGPLPCFHASAPVDVTVASVASAGVPDHGPEPL